MREPYEPAPHQALAHEAGSVTGEGITSLVAAFVSFALLVAIGVFRIAHLGTGLEAAVVLFGFLGLGSAPLQLSQSFGGLRFALLSISIGVSGVIMLGFLLIETRGWGVGPALYWTLAAAAFVLHLNAVRLHRSSLPALRQAFRPPTMSKVTQRVVGGAVFGFGACLAGAILSLHLDPKRWGLGGSISPIWWVGLVVLIGTFLFAWAKDSRAVGMVAVLCGAVITGTASLVYDVARFSWTQQHVGITQYFLTFGHTNTLHANGTIGIYQSWPGFFAGIAWLCHAAGVHNVEAIARWWPFGSDMVCLFGVRYIAGLFGFDRRQCWLAALLFTAANTVGQDYYSPQSVVYMLAILALGLVIRSYDGDRNGSSWDVWTYVLACAAIAVTHQITPYILFGELLIFMFFRLTTSRWLPLIPLLFGLSWALDNLSAVLKFYRVSGVGNIAANIKPPSATRGYHYPLMAHVSLAAEVAAPVAVGIIALIAFFVRRDRLALALGVVAASAGSLLLVVHYGAEDILRVALFAAPWLGLLAGYGLPRSRRTGARAKKHRVLRWRRSFPQVEHPPSWPRVRHAFRRYGYPGTVLVLAPCIILCYVLGNYGADFGNVVRAGDLSAEQYFEHHATGRSILIVLGQGGVPTDSTANYTKFGFRSLRVQGVTPTTAQNFAATFTQSLISSIQTTKRHKNVNLHYYVLDAQQAVAKTIYDGTSTKRPYIYFMNALVRQPGWSVVDKTNTATLVKFSPASAHLAPTKLAITASPNPAQVGNYVTIVATVSRNSVGGSFTFYIDGHTITGCTALPPTRVNGTYQAKCTTSSFTKGSHVIRAIYRSFSATASAAVHEAVSAP